MATVQNRPLHELTLEERVKKALRLVLPPQAVTELRALHTKQGVMSGYFDDLDALVDAALRLSGQADGVYVTLNPVDSRLLARAANRVKSYAKRATSDPDILRRRYLLFDFDPVRPSGISATEHEHDAALHRMIAAQLWLRDQGWPDPIITDSGNGGHLLYAIDLPNDAASTTLVERCLKALDFEFSDSAVVVDTSTGKAAQLWKVPGTWARKGDEVPERPHRRATLLALPELLTPVPRAVLEALASRAPAPPGLRSTTPGDAFDLAAWIERHRLEVVRTGPWNGGQKWILNRCPWNPAHTDRSAYIVQLPGGAVAAGCHHRSCAGKDWRALRDEVETSADTNSGDLGNSGEGNGPGWEPPVPFHAFALPAFPTAALPDWLRDYVEALATATQTPPDLAALVTLSVVAATCAKVVEIRVRPDWMEPVNLFTVVAMDPGNRKSAVFSAATAPLEAAEQLENQVRAPEILVAQSRLEAAKERLHEAQTALKKAPVEEQASRQQELENTAEDLAGIKVPPRCRRLVDDITAEKLTSLLAEQDGRLALMSAEGDIFDTLAGRYTAGGGVNLGVFLKAHSGDSIHVDRIGRPPEYVERPALTVCLTVQPEVVRGLHRRPEFKGRGLLARLFFALPESLLGRREIRPPSMPAQIRTQYQRAIEKLAALPIRQDSAGRVQAYELPLSREAQRILEEFERWLEPKLAPTGELASMTDWAGKLAGGIVRLAGLLHMATHWRDAAPAPWDRPIGEAPVTHAIQIGRYLIAHAQAAYTLMGADPEVEQAKILLAWVTAQQRTHFTVRELYQGTKGRFKKVAELTPGLRILVEHGFIRETAPTFHQRPGRKPSPTYEVNPLAYSQNPPNPRNPSRPEAGGSRPQAAARPSGRARKDRE